jgi:hypothetical protein
MDLNEILRRYDAEHRSNAVKEQLWFSLQDNLDAAIRTAALAIGPSGKRFSHQRRLPRAVLTRGLRALFGVKRQIRAALTFHDLFILVQSALIPLKGIGELTVYDTAVRLGAFLALEPDRIYLHAGTRVGARQLGFDGTRGWIFTSELPTPLDALPPSAAEDVLCIFKTQFGKRRAWPPPNHLRAPKTVHPTSNRRGSRSGC